MPSNIAIAKFGKEKKIVKLLSRYWFQVPIIMYSTYVVQPIASLIQ